MLNKRVTLTRTHFVIASPPAAEVAIPLAGGDSFFDEIAAFHSQ